MRLRQEQTKDTRWDQYQQS